MNNSSSGVLVTGAAGFIGARIVEHLVGKGEHKAIAAVRSIKGMPRLARLKGLEVRNVDLQQVTPDTEFLKGVSAIIHCAASTAETIVDGTRRLLQAARAANVQKVVVLSTVEVYASTPGRLTEETPSVRSGYWYNHAKIDMEAVCAEARESGMDLTVLRPSIVYGPFCRPWSIRYFERIQNGAFRLLPEASNGICNPVYVDDVVGASITGLRKIARGEAYIFNVSGPESCRWNEFFSGLNEAVTGKPLEPASAGSPGWRAKALKPVRSLAKTALKRWKTGIMKLYSQNPVAKVVFKKVENTLRNNLDEQELSVYSRQGVIVIDALTEKLGYSPRFHLPEGLARTGSFLKTYYQ